jgi:hypothetical protein
MTASNGPKVKKLLESMIDSEALCVRPSDRVYVMANLAEINTLLTQEPPVYESDAAAMICKGIDWFKEHDYMEGLPSEVLDLAEGDLVSIDVSTGDADAGNRVFGTILHWQDAGDGSRVWICELDHFNYDTPKQGQQGADSQAEPTQSDIERFEAWEFEEIRDPDFSKHSNGDYRSEITHAYFRGWFGRGNQGEVA